MMLPIGDHTKEAIRGLAGEQGLLVAEKPDSQEICFVPDGDYAGFVERTAPAADRSGPLLDRAGRELGRHGGVHQDLGRAQVRAGAVVGCQGRAR